MAKRSAGIFFFRRAPALEVLLVHPGGPFWAKKDLGAWSIPKGEHDEGEDGLACAIREFERGDRHRPDAGELDDLGTISQKAGKVVQAWALEGDLDADAVRSNTFAMQWPPRSGRMQEFPEVDRAEWFSLDAARERINPAQAAFLDRLASGSGHDLTVGCKCAQGGHTLRMRWLWRPTCSTWICRRSPSSASRARRAVLDALSGIAVDRDAIGVVVSRR